MNFAQRKIGLVGHRAQDQLRCTGHPAIADKDQHHESHADQDDRQQNEFQFLGLCFQFHRGYDAISALLHDTLGSAVTPLHPASVHQAIALRHGETTVSG